MDVIYQLMIPHIKKLLYAFIAIGLLFNYACAIQWTEAIRFGQISQNQFQETVDIEIRKGLIFVPVSIHGKEYRFLFDTGAPFSISNQLQNDFEFKIISNGNIVDSDHNRKKVKWAAVESIAIGEVSFIDQTAFIGDFEANPILSCLEIDGIIGSNLIRHCNWTIDQEHRSLTFFNGIEKHILNEGTTIPFKTDNQYNIFTDVGIGQATVKNVLIDYGSNGSIALNDEIFTALKGRNIIDETLTETGIQQSGIVGKTVALSREIVYTDSVNIDSMYLKKVMLRTGKTVSIGNHLLSRFSVTIDWKNRTLNLLENREAPDSIRFTGFKLGYVADQGVYIQSVVDNSNVYHEGLRPNMRVLKLDGLDFENGNDFCDYVSHELGNNIIMEVVDSTGRKMEYHFEQTIN